MKVRAKAFGAVVGMAVASAAMGQVSAEFRVVERQGQTGIPVPFGTFDASDGVLNFAVQGRAIGGTGNQFLSRFTFNIVASGEADANGTLARLLICNADGTFDANTTQSVNSVVGRGGLSAIYTSLAETNGAFNGSINTSSGTFTNTTGAQEIGLVTGVLAGSPLLLLTDANGDGNPDTYPGTGAVAAISPTVAATYLGAGGNWVDLYRFKYTTNSVTSRTITFQLANVNATVAFDLERVASGWRPRNEVLVPTSMSGVSVVVSGSGACCNAQTGACTLSTAAACGLTVFIAGTSCTPSPCPPLGSCCATSGACSVTLESLCGGKWASGGDCSPNPCPGACCFGSQCSQTSMLNCTRAHGVFHGAGVTCGTQGNFTTCCRANHNGLNGLTISDIFDYLGDWFAGSARADFDQSGAVNVSDIFGFLGAWFTGCF